MECGADACAPAASSDCANQLPTGHGAGQADGGSAPSHVTPRPVTPLSRSPQPSQPLATGHDGRTTCVAPAIASATTAVTRGSDAHSSGSGSSDGSSYTSSDSDAASDSSGVGAATVTRAGGRSEVARRGSGAHWNDDATSHGAGSDDSGSPGQAQQAHHRHDAERLGTRLLTAWRGGTSPAVDGATGDAPLGGSADVHAVGGGPHQQRGGGIIVLKGKVVVVGDVAVGKTSIVSRFAANQFSAMEPSSVGVAFSQHSMRLPGTGVHLNFDLWDTAGQERFRSINRMYYRSTAAGIAVYDVTSRVSFDMMRTVWLPQLREHCGAAVFIAIAGNKADLPASAREVPEEEGRAFAARHNCLFAETSAKTGANVNHLFELIGREAAARFHRSSSGGARDRDRDDGGSKSGEHAGHRGDGSSSSGPGGFQLHCLQRQRSDSATSGLRLGAGPNNAGTGSRRCCVIM